MGINIAGFLTAQSGLGTAVRGIVHACKSANIDYALLNVTCTDSAQDINEFAKQLSNECPHPISLLHVNPDWLHTALKELPKEFFVDKYKIGYWTWETNTLPNDWVTAIDLFDEIWVPSTYVQKTIAKHTDKPVIVVPHPVVIDAPEPIDLPGATCTFLCMFDYFSIVERKNPQGAINAFKNAFPDEDDVQLVIKTSNSKQFASQHAALHSAIHDKRIHLIDTPLTRNQTHGLIAQCDALVSLHRSEGFGLTLAEALALGTPVIATHYGGCSDFLEEGIGYTLVELEKNYGPYKKGSVWAEPDSEYAANMMQQVYNNTLRSQTLPQTFEASCVGSVIANRLTR